MNGHDVARVARKDAPVTACEPTTFPDMAEVLATPKRGHKDGEAWLPARIQPGPRRGERVEAVTYLVLDVEADAENVKGADGNPVTDEHGDAVKHVIGPEPPDVESMSAELGLWGWRSLLHTSYSHSEQHPRYRLVFDLDRELAPAELRPLGLHVAALLGLSDCIDKGALEPARLFYTPRCPTAERIAAFQSFTVPGKPLPVDRLLDAAQREQEAMRESAKRKHSSRTGNVIDGFNRTHDVRAILEAHGYQPKGRNRWLFANSTTGMPGMRLLPDSNPERVYSSHSGDPLNDGHAHDAFDVFRILDHGGDMARAVKAAAAELGEDRDGARAASESQTRTAPEPQGGNEHPLSRFIEISTDPKPPRWIVPHVITAGITIIAGGHGTGKTTAIVPLALAVAGVCARDYELAPQYWRHVVYVAEDVEQVERIIAGCVRDLCLNMDQIRERFHLVPACRMPAVDVVGVGAQYAERFTRTITTHGGDLSEAVTVELPPLVVFDTLPATIHLDDENSNAEASAAIAAIKQRFADLPAWLIGHVSKAALSKRDTATLRGASAWEADANQVVYLTAEDDGSRWMILGKRRFEATHVEFQIESRIVDSCAADEFGAMVAVRMRYGIVRPCEGRQAQREEAAERQRQSDDAELRGAILDAVEHAYKAGMPLSKSAVSGRIRRNNAETSKTVKLLLEDCWLYEIEVPKAQRVNPSKSRFLTRLTPAERDAMLTTGTVPERAIPPSWTRADFGNEPEQAGENEPVQPHDPAGQSPDSGCSESARSPKEKTPGTSGAGLEAPARAVPFPPVPESSRNEPERAGTSDSIEVFEV